MDLLDMRRKVENKLKWTSCYMDHYNGFAQVACLKSKRKETVGKDMSCMLQSDIGGEVFRGIH